MITTNFQGWSSFERFLHNSVKNTIQCIQCENKHSALSFKFSFSTVRCMNINCVKFEKSLDNRSFSSELLCYYRAFGVFHPRQGYVWSGWWKSSPFLDTTTRKLFRGHSSQTRRRASTGLQWNKVPTCLQGNYPGKNKAGHQYWLQLPYPHKTPKRNHWLAVYRTPQRLQM